MNKETVLMKDLAFNSKYPNDNDLHYEDWDTIKVIKNKIESVDREKGFTDYELVFQRLSDGKFFKVDYTEYGYNGDNIREKEAYEVFKKTKTIEYYK
jgi:hypothetical protein